ncbi:hypothetical protein Dred_3312 [Desulforamulus reducens MI-1]|uniref:Colicin V production protein n=1 Tax=Desulforamulus reducens (strain ATCC BAA-1160 / DSM 100696 / MI-1) TaxID=349161 RepID=A4J9Q9_DESRM|nr:hypothetical protein Dred_3312 [Desulforamulus reducens MI-1]
MVKSFIKLATLLIAFYAAVTYHNSVAFWLADNWGWADGIAQMIKPLVKLPGAFNNPEILKLPVDLLEKISSQVILPSPWTDIIAQLSQMGPNKTVGQALNLILAQGILKILAFVAIYIIVKTIAGVIAWMLEILLRFSPLGLMDKVGGLLLGFTSGMVIIVVSITILIPLQVPLALLGAGGFLGHLAQGIDHSYLIGVVGPIIKNQNLLPPLLTEFSSQFLFKHIPNGPGTEV